MHSLAPLVRDGNRRTAQLHPLDATRLGIAHGGSAGVCSPAGADQLLLDALSGTGVLNGIRIEVEPAG
jgi:hypothetical protein